MQPISLLLRTLLSLCFYFAATGSLQAQVAYHVEQPTDSVFRNDASIVAWLQENKVPVLGLGIIKDGKLQTANVYGNLKPGVPAPPQYPL